MNKVRKQYTDQILKELKSSDQEENILAFVKGTLFAAWKKFIEDTGIPEDIDEVWEEGVEEVDKILKVYHLILEDLSRQDKRDFIHSLRCFRIMFEECHKQKVDIGKN